MAPWMSEDDQGTGVELKTIWEYKLSMEFVTVIPETTRDLIMLTGDLDPTLSWNSPMGVWVHEFKVSQGKFATIFCNKWNEACPFCFENEIYKLQNPEYKNKGGRLPKGLSKKALLQVWDVQEKKKLWLLAGKQIQDGMDFILRQQAQNYKGAVAITRIGKGLSTNYRVDLSYATLDIKTKNKIKKEIWNHDKTMQEIFLTHQEIMTKSGINPPEYFSRMIPSHPEVDISSWGPVSAWDGQQLHQEVGAVRDVVETTNNNTAPPAQAPPISNNTGESMPPVENDISALPPEIQEALSVICTVGVYKDKNLQEIIVQTGKSFIQYLARSGSDYEKEMCILLLEQWDDIYQIVVDLPF